MRKKNFSLGRMKGRAHVLLYYQLIDFVYMYILFWRCGICDMCLYHVTQVKLVIKYYVDEEKNKSI